MRLRRWSRRLRERRRVCIQAMKSVLYVEEDFVAGLLRDYFVASRNSAEFLTPGANGLLADRLSRNAVDLFVAQSDDPDRLAKILETVRQQTRKTPTLVLTPH